MLSGDWYTPDNAKEKLIKLCSVLEDFGYVMRAGVEKQIEIDLLETVNAKEIHPIKKERGFFSERVFLKAKNTTDKYFEATNEEKWRMAHRLKEENRSLSIKLKKIEMIINPGVLFKKGGELRFGREGDLNSLSLAKVSEDQVKPIAFSTQNKFFECLRGVFKNIVFLGEDFAILKQKDANLYAGLKEKE